MIDEFNIDRLISIVSLIIATLSLPTSIFAFFARYVFLFYIAISILFILIVILALKTIFRDTEGIRYSRYSGFFHAWDLIRSNKDKNKSIKILEFNKNVRLLDGDSVTNTINLTGTIKSKYAEGLHITLCGGSENSNLTDVKYFLFENGDAKHVDFNTESHCQDLLQNSASILEENEVHAQITKKYPYAVALFLPFRNKLFKGDKFRIFLCYTWHKTFNSAGKAVGYFLEEFSGSADKLTSTVSLQSPPHTVGIRKVKVVYRKSFFYAIGSNRKVQGDLTILGNGDTNIISLEVNKPSENYILDFSLD